MPVERPPVIEAVGEQRAPVLIRVGMLQAEETGLQQVVPGVLLVTGTVRVRVHRRPELLNRFWSENWPWDRFLKR